MIYGKSIELFLVNGTVEALLQQNFQIGMKNP